MSERKVLVVVGTKKGLLVFTSRDRQSWQLQGESRHKGLGVNHAIYDGRSGTVYATANDAWFGSQIM